MRKQFGVDESEKFGIDISLHQQVDCAGGVTDRLNIHGSRSTGVYRLLPAPPQAMMPFDAEELAYIAALDARADCEVLARELPALRPECGRTLQVSTALLQAAAAAGLRCLAPLRPLATTPCHSRQVPSGFVTQGSQNTQSVAFSITCIA